MTFHGPNFISKTSEIVDSGEVSGILATILRALNRSFSGHPYIFEQDNASVQASAYTVNSSV